MNSFGKGPILKEACSWLQDDADRLDSILDVTERDSVIEGLPPFRDETRQQLLQQLEAISEPQPKPAE